MIDEAKILDNLMSGFKRPYGKSQEEKNMRNI